MMNWCCVAGVCVADKDWWSILPWDSDQQCCVCQWRPHSVQIVEWRCTNNSRWSAQVVPARFQVPSCMYRWTTHRLWVPRCQRDHSVTSLYRDPVFTPDALIKVEEFVGGRFVKEVYHTEDFNMTLVRQHCCIIALSVCVCSDSSTHDSAGSSEMCLHICGSGNCESMYGQYPQFLVCSHGHVCKTTLLVNHVCFC